MEREKYRKCEGKEWKEKGQKRKETEGSIGMDDNEGSVRERNEKDSRDRRERKGSKRKMKVA